MASPLHFLLFFSIFFFLVNNPFHAQSSQFPNSVFFPVTRDPSTLQYVSKIFHGDPAVPIDLVVDLGGPLLWINCATPGNPIPSCSIQCSKTKANNLESKQSCSVKAGCHVVPRNSITRLATRGDLVEGIIAFDSIDRSNARQITTVDHFLFSCAPAFLLKGLANGAQGVLGLGRAPASPSSQLTELTTAIGRRSKFSICLSSSKGFVISGNGHSIFDFETTGPLTYTPLIGKQDYLINVQSIKINGKRLSVEKSKLSSVDEKGKGGTKLSTTVPYTTMESSIYATFTKAYIKAAASINMSRVDAVAPFGLCFSSEGVVDSVVPSVDLVLQSEMVKWRIDGRNLVVRVSDEVMCLGILDGGLEQRSSIVMGGLQLEDKLLEFDMGASMLGFSFSLLTKETACSDLVSKYYILREVL